MLSARSGPKPHHLRFRQCRLVKELRAFVQSTKTAALAQTNRCIKSADIQASYRVALLARDYKIQQLESDSKAQQAVDALEKDMILALATSTDEPDLQKNYQVCTQAACCLYLLYMSQHIRTQNSFTM